MYTLLSLTYKVITSHKTSVQFDFCTYLHSTRSSPSSNVNCYYLTITIWHGSARVFHGGQRKSTESAKSINTSSDVVLRKARMSLRGSRKEKKIHFDTHFSKPVIWGLILTGLGKFWLEKALTITMLTCELPLIVIV